MLAEPETEVSLIANGLAEVVQEAVLVETHTDGRRDLKEDAEVTVSVGGESGEATLRLLVGSMAYVEETTLPDQLTLSPPYPNPTTGRVTVEYALPEPADVQVEVYDVLGRRVVVLEEGSQKAGSRRIKWDGDTLSSGMYFIHLEASGQTKNEQFVVVR